MAREAHARRAEFGTNLIASPGGKTILASALKQGVECSDRDSLNGFFIHDVYYRFIFIKASYMFFQTLYEAMLSPTWYGLMTGGGMVM